MGFKIAYIVKCVVLILHEDVRSSIELEHNLELK